MVILKKTALIALAVVGCALCVSCSFVVTNPEVRFENGITGFTFGYGVRLGEAEFIGSLDEGQITPYLETPAGAYVLQARTASGEWRTFSAGVVWVFVDHTYTIAMSGAWDPDRAEFTAGPTISVIQDS